MKTSGIFVIGLFLVSLSACSTVQTRITPTDRASQRALAKIKKTPSTLVAFLV